MKNAKDWLASKHYDEVLLKIARVEGRWKKRGKKTRRNWWDVLAGHRDGTPVRVEGILFPILQAARLRKGWEVTPNSVSRSEEERALPIMQQSRWLERGESPHEL